MCLEGLQQNMSILSTNSDHFKDGSCANLVLDCLLFIDYFPSRATYCFTACISCLVFGLTFNLLALYTVESACAGNQLQVRDTKNTVCPYISVGLSSFTASVLNFSSSWGPESEGKPLPVSLFLLTLLVSDLDYSPEKVRRLHLLHTLF